jgi:hypothetical protein
MLAVTVVALGMFLVARQRPAVAPFDPRSSSELGARALVLLLEEFDVDVDVSRDVPVAGSDRRVLVLDDRLDADQRTLLVEYVEQGGVAVVADPDSALHGGPGLDGGSVEVGGADGTSAGTVLGETNVPRGRCSLPALDHLRGLSVDAGLAFPVGPDERSCFTNTDGDGGRHAFVVERRIGDGLVVGLGDNVLFTNSRIRYADNAGLAAALLVPGGRVTVLIGNEAQRSAADLGDGDQTLVDLVRPSVWMAAVQAALAFVVLAAARGIRPGRPVVEALPTPVPGSDTVEARASLLRRGGRSDRAARWVRAGFHRDVCDHERVSRSTPPDELARLAGVRHGVDPMRLRRVLAVDRDDEALAPFARTRPDDALVALTVELAELRRLLGVGEPAVDEDPVARGGT